MTRIKAALVVLLLMLAGLGVPTATVVATTSQAQAAELPCNYKTPREARMRSLDTVFRATVFWKRCSGSRNGVKPTVRNMRLLVVGDIGGPRRCNATDPFKGWDVVFKVTQPRTGKSWERTYHLPCEKDTVTSRIIDVSQMPRFAFLGDAPWNPTWYIGVKEKWWGWPDHSMHSGGVYPNSNKG